MATAVAYGGSVDAEGAGKFLGQLFRPGYAQGLGVVQRGAGANMSVDVPVGSCGVLTSSGVSYFGWNTATVNVAITTANPTNPRRDIVVAYVDLSAITTATTNNAGALKFLSVAGTPAGSPSDPSDPTIQSAVGASNPYTKLCRVTVAAAAASIVNANIISLRTPMSLNLTFFYGGSNSTLGHLMPNVVDGTIVVTSDVNAIPAQLLSTSAISLGNATIATNFTTTSTTPVQVTGLTTTVTIPSGSRKIRVEASTGNLFNTGSGQLNVIQIWDGTVGSGTKIAEATTYSAASSTGAPVTLRSRPLTVSAGSKTYNVAIYAVFGGTASLAAGTGSEAYIAVEAA